MLLLLSLLSACDMTPNYVEASDVDNALARRQYKTVCVGLRMTDDEVRQHTTERMRTITEPEGIAAASACICEHIKHPDHGWDRAIAAGLKGEPSDAFTKCFADLVVTPGLPDQKDAVAILVGTPSPSSRAALAQIATSSASAETRAAALAPIGSMEEHRPAIIGLLKDSDAGVRAAAADALGSAGRDRDAAEALQTATQDPEGVVRAAALSALKRTGAATADDAMCTAMMNDPDPVVRAAAVSSFKGTKRTNNIKCLRDRALALEEDATVRQAVLDTLKSSTHDDAAKALCEAIPFWMRSYLKEDLPEKIPGTDIIKAQNDRDWEASYGCVERAYRSSSGYSCYAKMYVAYWYDQLGGKAFSPRCPKYMD
jgi:hypothetical protein